MNKIINKTLLICSIILSVVAVTNAQKKVIYYWDFNQAYPIGGAGLDSLGTSYSYTNSTRDTLYAPYESFGVDRARIVYSRPPGKQTTPLAATKRDSILDDGNGAPFCYINDLHILGNDTSSNQANNDFVRSRNPDENSYLYLYLPTTGYKNIVLNYAISASSTKGAFYNIFSYSTNGGATWNNLTTAMDTFNISGVFRPDTLQVINPTTASSNWYPVKINFTSDPNVNNNANFILRWQYEGIGSNGTSGNDRYDNLSLVGDSTCAYFATNPVNVISCNTGNAKFIVSVAGGTPPYTLLWQVDSGSGWLNLSNSPPYSGVHSDTLNITGTTFSMSGYHYRCEIAGTCGGNTFSSPATLIIDAPLNDSIVGINLNDTVITFCTPTSATVGANGGTAPYTFLWEPGGQTTTTVNGLGTGNYTITVTDAIGCSASTSLFVIGDTALVEITGTSQTNIECSSIGSATVTAGRGVPPYTYLWTPGSQTNATATGLSAGTYTISVSDSTGCNTTASVTIISSPLIRDSIIALNTQVIHYWDFNQTKPSGGGGGDSLGTSTFPLSAPYTLIPSANPRIVYSRPSARQTTPLNSTLKDSTLDNGSQGAFVNDLNRVAAINAVLGNDTNSSLGNNLFVRSRNPDENSFMYMYIPTNGYKNIQLNYAISASSTKGALYNVFSYSTNGGVTWNPLTAVMDTFNTGGHSHPDSLQMINPTTAASLWYPVHINLGADTNTGNNPNLVIRWQFEGTSSNGTSGNDRYDNFSVSGTLSQEQCNGNNNFSAEAGVKYGIAPYTYSWSPSGGTNAIASNLSAGTYTVTVADANGCNAASTISITQAAVLTASVASSTNPLCFNTNTGTATASASGGTSPYGYRWTPSNNTNATATGLSAGTYTVTVTDLNGCTATSSVTLTSPTQLRDSITLTTNATCNSGNGNVSVGVSGGTSPYTYQWNPGGNTNASANLSAGTYTVIVTDNNGCTNTAVATISQPVAIRDSITNIVGAQVVIHYWDFNNTLPVTGTGGDSLGTSTFPLPAQYSLVNSAKIVYSRPLVKQTLPLNCTVKDSIFDNGTGAPECYVNDLHILGNDSASSASGNLFVRSRNPDENAFVYLYLPTTGYSNIQMNYAISASSTKGALYNVFSYSTNGGATWNPLTAAMDTFNTGGHAHPDSLQMINPTTASSNWYPVHINFSSDASINNNPNFILRWEYEGTSSNGTSGNDRYDNISVLGNASNEVCNGSSNVNATVGVKNGTAPYTYAWSPSGGSNATASNLSAGTYTVNITDINGCTGT
ncbi:MAG TPA: hypothetical protein VK809_11860, partial [Bacteroidia bacterium]|nr:hypothetical protein [Bacteroidia bacterium]